MVTTPRNFAQFSTRAKRRLAIGAAAYTSIYPAVSSISALQPLEGVAMLLLLPFQIVAYVPAMAVVHVAVRLTGGRVNAHVVYAATATCLIFAQVYLVAYAGSRARVARRPAEP